MAMKSVPCTLMRGGTTKGILFRKEVLPSEESKRDEVILKIFGSGDSAQTDGIGAVPNVSKTMIVWKSSRAGVDLDYYYGQMGAENWSIDHTGNCGNLTSAVGPFGIDEGIVKVRGSRVLLRLYNVNTKKRVDASVPLEDGLTQYEGDYMIDGVPNPGSRIDVIWHDPGGAVSGKLLPTGNPVDKVKINGGSIECSIVDASNPVVFVRAKDVSMSGTELPNQVDPSTVAKLERIRSQAAMLMGLVTEAEEATTKTPHIPFVAVVGEAQDYLSNGKGTIKQGEYDLLIRMFSMQEMHHACALTGAICTAVAAEMESTIVGEFYGGSGKSVIIGHPKGTIDIGVKVRPKGDSVQVESVTVGRTARKLISGLAFYLDS